ERETEFRGYLHSQTEFGNEEECSLAQSDGGTRSPSALVNGASRRRHYLAPGLESSTQLRSARSQTLFANALGFETPFHPCSHRTSWDQPRARNGFSEIACVPKQSLGTRRNVRSRSLPVARCEIIRNATHSSD